MSMKSVVISVIVDMEHRGKTVNIYPGPAVMVSRVVIMVNVPHFMANLFVIAIMITLEQTVLLEIFVGTINANIVQRVLIVNPITHVIVQMGVRGNIANKSIIVSVVHAKI